MGVLLLLGVLIISYPFVSNQLNTFLDQQLISFYQSQAKKMSEIEKQQKRNQVGNEQIKSWHSNPAILESKKRKIYQKQETQNQLIHLITMNDIRSVF